MSQEPVFTPLPEALPAVGSPDRWPWLQRLRRQGELDLEAWLVAVEQRVLVPGVDLLTVLADRLDAAAASRLLAWWLNEPDADPALLAVIGRCRDARCRLLLLQALAPAGAAEPSRAAVLLPLLGHQRNPADFAMLLDLALGPHPLGHRRAALEGLTVGLAAWPAEALGQGLVTLAGDLDPALAAAAVDLLARLPQGRQALLRLAQRSLAPGVEPRIQRRLNSLPPRPPAGSS